MTIQIPKWFDDPEAPWPCPCGRPPFGQMVPVKSEEGSTILVHYECALIGGVFDGMINDGD